MPRRRDFNPSQDIACGRPPVYHREHRQVLRQAPGQQLIYTLFRSCNNRYMLRDDNQAIVQLLSGWGRTYKPILYDEVQPQVAVFGASWARDAFDPIETTRLLGRSVFNHGVSGATRYETRRFADSALDNPNLRVAIINLNTFYRDKVAARFRYGFDESILNVDADAEGWLLQRAARCQGDWGEDGYRDLVNALKKQ